MFNSLASILSLCLLSSCAFFSEKNYSTTKIHQATYTPCEQLFMENFIITQQGALGGDYIETYLTDSISFRVLVGKYNNAHEVLHCICKDRKIIFLLFTNNGADSSLYKTFNLDSLKNTGNYQLNIMK